MSATPGIRMKNPAHPGGFVKSEVIEPLGLSVTNAAQVLGVTRAALSAVLNERAHLSPEMALRIEKAFGVSMDTLMRMQNSYDIAQARKREGEIEVARFKGRLANLSQRHDRSRSTETLY
ncbi:MAG: HigA family addiction module antitoxin [Acetobacteraceae bacterium]